MLYVDNKCTDQPVRLQDDDDLGFKIDGHLRHIAASVS